MDTYFSRRPRGPEELLQITLEHRGVARPWTSAPGIFQSKGLDAGTALLLEVARDLDGRSVVDLGCGHGALGLLDLLERPGARAWLLDVNPRAVRAAAANRDRLRLPALVLQGEAAAALRDGCADLVLTNPPIRAGNRVLEVFWREAARLLVPGGTLAFVVRPKQGGRRLAAMAGQALGGPPEKQARKKGYEVFSVVRG